MTDSKIHPPADPLSDAFWGATMALEHVRRVAASEQPVAAYVRDYSEVIMSGAWQRLVEQWERAPSTQQAKARARLAETAEQVREALSAMRERRAKDAERLS